VPEAVVSEGAWEEIEPSLLPDIHGTLLELGRALVCLKPLTLFANDSH
jgi:hypothetical protein